MAEKPRPAPRILGPSGQPIRAPQSRAAGPEPPRQADAEAPPSAESPPAEEPSGGEAAPGPSQAFQVIAALTTDPRQLPAALVVLLDHDPMSAYRRRLESAQESFETSRGAVISAIGSRMTADGMPEDEAQATAARYVDQQFMSSAWDVAYQTVPALRVALVMSAGLFGGQNTPAAVLMADEDVPTMWLTTRSVALGDRFGAWAIPIERSSTMPVSVALTAENYQPLRVRYARVKV